MSKAIMVLNDMPTSCKQCYAYKEKEEDLGVCDLTYVMTHSEILRPSWCPLKKAPKTVEASILDIHNKNSSRYLSGWEDGWNSCVEQILGGGTNE